MDGCIIYTLIDWYVYLESSYILWIIDGSDEYFDLIIFEIFHYGGFDTILHVVSKIFRFDLILINDTVISKCKSQPPLCPYCNFHN